MKQFGKRLVAWAMAGCMCLSTAAAKEVVYVDTTEPYTGKYYMSYNTQTGVIEMVTAGGVSLFAAEQADDSDASVIAVRDDGLGGQAVQVEPQNLERRIKPLERRSVQPFSARSQTPKYGDERKFVTLDMRDDSPAEDDFVLKYVGEHCNIWLQKTMPIPADASDTIRKRMEDVKDMLTDELITQLGAEYDVKIHDTMIDAFGAAADVDGDGKLAILLYDVQDGYPNNADHHYVGGFFFSGDLHGSDYNGMDVIHIDTWPSLELGGLAEVESTTVHELQHLIEASAPKGSLPIWLNEGLSMAAEHMIYGPKTERVDYFNQNVECPMPLAVWNSKASLPNYAMSYLFVQYLRTLTKDFSGGGEALYQKIIGCETGWGVARLVSALEQFYPYITIDELYRNFYIALTLKMPPAPMALPGRRGPTSWRSSCPGTTTRAVCRRAAPQ